MSIWLLMTTICLIGGIGGFVNSLLSDNKFLLPSLQAQSDGAQIVRPGCMGNIVTGALAAWASWALYGPLSSFLVISAGTTSTQPVAISLATLGGAFIVGLGGARWLSNEVDKKLLRSATSSAIVAPSLPDLVQQIKTASPAKVLSLMQQLHVPVPVSLEQPKIP